MLDRYGSVEDFGLKMEYLGFREQVWIYIKFEKSKINYFVFILVSLQEDSRKKKKVCKQVERKGDQWLFGKNVSF